jgi:aminopeptidase N
MHETRPRVVHRKDYRPPPYLIESVDLSFDLDPEATLVRARMQIRRSSAWSDAPEPLALHGERLELLELRIDGRELAAGEYQHGEELLTLPTFGESGTVETLVKIRPAGNTELSGLYTSSGNFCTQCEAEGFRRITFFLDRPDVMARYSATLVADEASWPVLLSNGNRAGSGRLAGGRHWVRYEDPYPKPSYLFALVAGKLACHTGEFTTRSGRHVRLEIWVEPENLDRCDHALRSLRRAMRWDEDRFGLEYDLDVYMIVAVSDFNMGAMENKGLNIFNSKYVLACPATATDDDYEAIEGVIGHEYFHNWTGNRVTCRDWFQLTLKEGLTVFRDQEFSADMTSASVKRIADVRMLRLAQFPEDTGPMAHPIRPESYVAMDNFYTATVYNKGAEVVRMIQTLVGVDGFRRGLELYLRRHDGQAVSCDDFRAALAEANGRDLDQFERWYLQAGTPILRAEGRYESAERRYVLTLRQSRRPYPGAGEHLPWHIPVAVGLLGSDGKDLPLALAGGASTVVLDLREEEQSFVFEDVPVTPIPSLLRGYSAPVVLEMERPRAELAFSFANDSDAFQRWEAGQRLATDVCLELASRWRAGDPLELDPILMEAYRALLRDPSLDGSFRALALMLPAERALALERTPVDVDALHSAREFVRASIARNLAGDLEAVWEANAPRGEYAHDKESIDRRRIANSALSYLSLTGMPEIRARLKERALGADNMTDVQAAVAILADLECPEREEVLETFHARWQSDPLVLDKWFTIQALSRLPSTPERVFALASHADFNLRNPNRVRALVGAFTQNQVRFHAPDGAGYRFLADVVLELDRTNPQLAARMASALQPWRRFDPSRQAKMSAELERISAVSGLSKDVWEIIERALGNQG